MTDKTDKTLNKNLNKTLKLSYTLQIEVDYKSFVKFLNDHFAEDDDKDDYHQLDTASKKAWNNLLQYFKTNSKKLEGTVLNPSWEPGHEGSLMLAQIVGREVLESESESE